MKKQLEIARVMTGSKTQNIIIETQFKQIDQQTAYKSAVEVDRMVKENDLPFDKVFAKVKHEFQRIAGNYKIDPATLFCIYMEWKNKI